MASPNLDLNMKDTSPIEESRECIVLYSERCFRCSHLVDGAPETFTKCHYEQGNHDCPAIAIRIMTSGKVRKFIRRIEEAQAAKDAPKVAKIWEEVTKESPEVQRRIFDVMGI